MESVIFHLEVLHASMEPDPLLFSLWFLWHLSKVDDRGLPEIRLHLLLSTHRVGVIQVDGCNAAVAILWGLKGGSTLLSIAPMLYVQICSKIRESSNLSFCEIYCYLIRCK